MRPEPFRLLAGVIAAHPNHRLIGRVRLQKTVKLLQSYGLQIGYRFKNYHYGPYSEGLQADTGLLQVLGWVEEKEKRGREGRQYYTFEAKEDSMLEELEPYNNLIELFANSDPVVLELAATYKSFLEAGLPEDEALERVRLMKPIKSQGGRDKQAIELIEAADQLQPDLVMN